MGEHPAHRRRGRARSSTCPADGTCRGRRPRSRCSSSSAGAGGAVLSACFDVVLARPSINLNYHYGAMGLSGSELRSLVLPLRAGEQAAEQLLTERLPISPMAAQRLGLVDGIGPDNPVDVRPLGQAGRHTARRPAAQGPAAGRHHPVPAAGADRHVARHLRGPPRVRGQSTPLPRPRRLSGTLRWRSRPPRARGRAARALGTRRDGRARCRGGPRPPSPRPARSASPGQGQG